jgi:hypothetical protein
MHWTLTCQVGIRIVPDTLVFCDLDTRELLPVRPNPLSHDKIARLRGTRAAGPSPRPSPGQPRPEPGEAWPLRPSEATDGQGPPQLALNPRAVSAMQRSAGEFGPR